VVFSISYPVTYGTLEIIEEFRKAIQAESSLQATYLELHPEVSATYFHRKSLWDKILHVSKLTVFERLYSMLKQGSLSQLWQEDPRENRLSDLLIYTYIRYCIWAGPPQNISVQ
jgi:hypothetical protein